MRRVFAVAAVLALLAQAPRAQAVPPVVTWCVNSPGAAEFCSPVRERVLASVKKRLSTGEDWAVGQGLTIARVQ